MPPGRTSPEGPGKEPPLQGGQAPDQSQRGPAPQVGMPPGGPLPGAGGVHQYPVVLPLPGEPLPRTLGHNRTFHPSRYRLASKARSLLGEGSFATSIP